MDSELSNALDALSAIRPFSVGDLRRLGKAYKDGKEPDAEVRNSIETWYEGLGRAATIVVRSAIEQVIGADEAKQVIKGTAQRLKTNKTLV